MFWKSRFRVHFNVFQKFCLKTVAPKILLWKFFFFFLKLYISENSKRFFQSISRIDNPKVKCHFKTYRIAVWNFGVEEEKTLFRSLLHRGLDCSIVGQGNQEVIGGLDINTKTKSSSTPVLSSCTSYKILILKLISWKSRKCPYSIKKC